ncbi:hypothetical protein LI328DRAFT_129713 [Trichoderma asperelloides]|nr:hypothetical protein LI328DRAFT_129713 [Trichoderma asperelloides]
MSLNHLSLVLRRQVILLLLLMLSHKQYGHGVPLLDTIDNGPLFPWQGWRLLNSHAVELIRLPERGEHWKKCSRQAYPRELSWSKKVCVVSL